MKITLNQGLINLMRENAKSENEAIKSQSLIWLKENKVAIENYEQNAAQREANERKKDGINNLASASKFFAVQWRNIRDNKELTKELNQNGLDVYNEIQNITFVKNHFDLLGLLTVDNCLKLFKSSGKIEVKPLVDLALKFANLTDGEKLVCSKRGDEVFNLLKSNRENGFSISIFDGIVKALQHDLTKAPDKRKDYVHSKNAVQLVIHFAPKRLNDVMLSKFPAIEGGDVLSGIDAYLMAAYNIKYIEFKRLISQKCAHDVKQGTYKTMIELLNEREEKRKAVVNEQTQKPKTNAAKVDA